MPKKDLRVKTNLKDLEHVLVYSTDPKPLKGCVKCHEAIERCKCRPYSSEQIRIIKPSVRIEKKGRGGKVVTILSRLPTSESFLKALCASLKRSFGSGGTFYVSQDEGFVEIQGDWRNDILLTTQKYLEKLESSSD